MQGIQFGNLNLEEAQRYSKEKRCWKCHQQNRHAAGCNSKYQFKSNQLEVLPEEKLEVEESEE